MVAFSNGTISMEPLRCTMDGADIMRVNTIRLPDGC
jgi:hypothetical protein